MKRLKIFGILNITPDSFSDGGKYFNSEEALNQAGNLLNKGADFIDIGGQSTRPNAVEITPEEEWGRVKNVIKVLLKTHKNIISLDTKHAFTAQKFIELGGNILNDVSGFQDPKMRDLAVKYQPQIIINHFPGKTIDEVHAQQIDSINQVEDELLTRANQLIEQGIKPEKIILDPGIGFGKTMELNTQLLTFAQKINFFPILIGHSKKRFLGKQRYEDDVNIKAAQTAMDAGTQYLRVHDPQIYKNITTL